MARAAASRARSAPGRRFGSRRDGPDRRHGRQLDHRRGRRTGLQHGRRDRPAVEDLPAPPRAEVRHGAAARQVRARRLAPLHAARPPRTDAVVIVSDVTGDQAASDAEPCDQAPRGPSAEGEACQRTADCRCGLRCVPEGPHLLCRSSADAPAGGGEDGSSGGCGVGEAAGLGPGALLLIFVALAALRRRDGPESAVEAPACPTRRARQGGSAPECRRWFCEGPERRALTPRRSRAGRGPSQGHQLLSLRAITAAAPRRLLSKGSTSSARKQASWSPS